MKIISSKNDYIFIACDCPSHNKELWHKQVIFIDSEIYDFVVRCLEPKLEFLKKLLSDTSLGRGTLRYWKENWNNKLTKEIVDISGFDRIEVSNSISAYLE